MKKALPVQAMLLIFAVVTSPVITLAQEASKTPKLVMEGSEQQRTSPPFDRKTAGDPDATADDAEKDAEDDEPVQRVARVTFIEGDVSFLRAGVTEWSDAVENLPLLSGDQIYVGERGRAEIQFGRGNYVRLSEKTALTITELTHTAAVLDVTEGIALVRLERFGQAWDRFEIDTPNSALVLQQDGLYRINVRGDRESEIIIRRGLAEVACDDGDFKVRDGQRLTIDTRPQGRLEIAADTSNDDWDRWSYDRDQIISQTYTAPAPDYVTQYETDYHCFYGVSDLSNFGSWISYSGYGNCWVPRVSVGWAPYRTGQWLWIPRAGWTWLSREPWGWAPYHYGRWVFLNNIGWAWSPGINTRSYQYRHSYYQWRPALVAFFNCPTPRGNYIGWYPLAPGERWRRPANLRNDDGHRHMQYPVARDGNRRPDGGNPSRPRFGNGVSVLPVGEFVGNRRSDRLAPTAPDRDVTNWVNRGVRAGLPDLGNAENGAATVWRRGNAFAGSRRVATPPAEVINRPVVTRHRPVDSVAETSAPRERRLIGTPALRQGGTGVTRGGRFDDASGGDSRSRSKDGQTKADDTHNGHGQENNRKRNEAAGVNTFPSPNEDSSRNRRTRPVGDEAGSTGDATNKSGSDWRNRPRVESGGGKDGETNRRGERAPRRSDNPDSQNEQNNSNSDERSRPRPDRGSAKPSGDDSTTRTYTPREQPSSDQSERQQRKEERRQEQQRQEQQRQQQQRTYEAPPQDNRRQEKQERRQEQQQQKSERQAERQQRKNNN